MSSLSHLMSWNRPRRGGREEGAALFSGWRSPEIEWPVQGQPLIKGHGRAWLHDTALLAWLSSHYTAPAAFCDFLISRHSDHCGLNWLNDLCACDCLLCWLSCICREEGQRSTGQVQRTFPLHICLWLVLFIWLYLFFAQKQLQKSEISREWWVTLIDQSQSHFYLVTVS